MEVKRIPLQGMDVSLPSFQEAELKGKAMEIVNLRYRNNAWRPVPEKEQLYNTPITYTFTKMWIHVQDDIENYIGLDSNYNLRIVDFVGDSELIKAYSGEVDIVFLKRFMIVIHSSGMDRYLYKDDEYKLITITQEPVFSLSVDDETYINENDDLATTADALLGKYYARLKTLTKDNYFAGGFMIRAAYKLFDGSYILHTLPYYLSVDDHVFELHKTAGYYRIEFYAAQGKVTFTADDYSDMDDNRDIIQSVVLFATKVETLLDISEDTLTDESLNEWISDDYGWTYLNNELEVSDDFKELPESSLWYKVGEYSFSGILDGEVTEEDIDLEDFYFDYGIRETLPVDQFSHHSLRANIKMNYNSRLILADTKQTLALKEIYEHQSDELVIQDSGSEWKFIKTEDEIDIAVKFVIDTDDGEKDVWTYQTVRKWYEDQYISEEVIVLQGVIGYPDKRAKECKIYVLDDGDYKFLKTLNLTASKTMNYAYYHESRFNSGIYNEGSSPEMTTGGAWWNFNMIALGFNRTGAFKLPDDNTLNTNADPDNEITDSNRVQISEVNNPYYFPAKNSYQVGTGEIRAIGTNTEPLSTGQFGEYPLQIFTSKGIWVMMQGQEDVVFSNIVPSGSEVIKEGSDIVPIGNAVVFRNEKDWIFALSGRELRRVSLPLDNPQDVDFLDNTNFQFFINHSNIVNIDTIVDGVSLKSYLSDSKLGFDKENNELVITNDNYDYSYVFNFDTGVWFKISESYSVLINNYPFLEGLNDDGLMRLSSEVSTENVQTLFVTREQSLDFNEVYKKLDRSIIRLHGKTDTSYYAGYYIFGSDDLYNWQLTGGNDHKTGSIKDIRASRSHKKWKYYIFVLVGKLSTDSILTNIDTQFTLKANMKLR